MLTIENIVRLKNETIGEWKIGEAYQNSNEAWMNCPHYCITFTRDGYGAAVLIDRSENPLLGKYRIIICYENYDTTIYETALTKESISKKDTFLALMLQRINAEWSLRHSKV